LIIAELGWGIVHERIINSLYRVPIEISCDGQQIKLTALVDTGNQLKDPINRQPVIIVDMKALHGVLPPELTEILLSLDEGDPSALDRLSAVKAWQTRLRLIPFSSIGKNSGLLMGFRADEVKIGAHPLAGEFQPTIAVHPRDLDPHGEYMALVPPHLVEYSINTLEGGETHVNATPSDL
jgi:stage II sporulation protein GA (sporulation sigma-E factor processing peptidase)